MLSDLMAVLSMLQGVTLSYLGWRKQELLQCCLWRSVLHFGVCNSEPNNGQRAEAVLTLIPWSLSLSCFSSSDEGDTIKSKGCLSQSEASKNEESSF